MTDDLWDKATEEDLVLLEENQKLAPLLGEINMIQNDAIKSFTRAMLMAVNTFWEAPASITGKYHPPDERGKGGDVLHTQRVVRITKILAESMERDDYETDVLLSAALLHDIRKNREWAPGVISGDKLHPLQVDLLFKQVRERELSKGLEQGSLTTELDSNTIDKILRLVRCHLGPWSPIPEVVPVTPFEATVHWADAIAAKLHKVIDFPDVESPTT